MKISKGRRIFKLSCMKRVYKLKDPDENVCHDEDCFELITRRYYCYCDQHIDEVEFNRENRLMVRARLAEDGFNKLLYPPYAF